LDPEEVKDEGDKPREPLLDFAHEQMGFMGVEHFYAFLLVVIYMEDEVPHKSKLEGEFVILQLGGLSVFIEIVELYNEVLKFWLDPVVGGGFYCTIINVLTESCILNMICEVVSDIF
jgi:hypothetical protein